MNDYQWLRMFKFSKFYDYPKNFLKRFRENYNKYLIKDYFFFKTVRWENIKKEPIEKIVVFLKKKVDKIDEGIEIINGKIKNEEKSYRQISKGEIFDFESRTSEYKHILKQAKSDINEIINYLEKILSDIDNKNMYSLRRNILSLMNFLEKWSEKDAVEQAIEKNLKIGLFSLIIVSVVSSLLFAIIFPLKKLKEKEKKEKEKKEKEK